MANASDGAGRAVIDALFKRSAQCHAMECEAAERGLKRSSGKFASLKLQRELHTALTRLGEVHSSHAFAIERAADEAERTEDEAQSARDIVASREAEAARNAAISFFEQSAAVAHAMHDYLLHASSLHMIALERNEGGEVAEALGALMSMHDLLRKAAATPEPERDRAERLQRLQKIYKHTLAEALKRAKHIKEGPLAVSVMAEDGRTSVLERRSMKFKALSHYAEKAKAAFDDATEHRDWCTAVQAEAAAADDDEEEDEECRRYNKGILLERSANLSLTLSDRISQRHAACKVYDEAALAAPPIVRAPRGIRRSMRSSRVIMSCIGYSPPRGMTRRRSRLRRSS